LLRAIPVADFNTSVATCPFAPATPTLNLPGSFFAASTNSLKVLGAIFGNATSAVPAEINWLTGAKSRTGSYGSLR
jgi:hypothetical protein